MHLKTFLNYSMLIFAMNTSSVFAQSNSSSNSKSTAIQSVKLTSIDNCPYICPHTLRNRGLILDIVAMSFKEVGISVDYEYSESRSSAVATVKSGAKDILLGFNKSQTEQLDYADNFYINDETSFVILKKSRIKLAYAKDLKTYKLGLIEGTSFDNNDGSWNKAIAEHTLSRKSNQPLAELQLLKLLEAKNIDIAVMNWDFAKYNMQQSEQDKFRTIQKDIITKLHLGFTISERGRVLKRKFIEGFNRLLDTEKLEQIYLKYQMQMPEFSYADF